MLLVVDMVLVGALVQHKKLDLEVQVVEEIMMHTLHLKQVAMEQEILLQQVHHKEILEHQDIPDLYQDLMLCILLAVVVELVQLVQL